MSELKKKIVEKLIYSIVACVEQIYMEPLFSRILFSSKVNDIRMVFFRVTFCWVFFMKNCEWLKWVTPDNITYKVQYSQRLVSSPDLYGHQVLKMLFAKLRSTANFISPGIFLGRSGDCFGRVNWGLILYCSVLINSQFNQI